MPHLKNKIARVQEQLKKHHKNSKAGLFAIKPPQLSPQKNKTVDFKPLNNITSPEEGSPLSNEGHIKGSTSCKNILKNYIRALINFALSETSLPFLSKKFQEGGLNPEVFRNLMNSRKTTVNSIKDLRELLLVDKRQDSPEMIVFKQTFKDLSVNFIKFYCVNWVFHSRVSDKITHLNYRFKILRRIRNPEHFTYLESFSEKSNNTKGLKMK